MALTKPVERAYFCLVHQYVPERHNAEDCADEWEHERPIEIGAFNCLGDKHIAVQRHESVSAERKHDGNDCEPRLQDALLVEEDNHEIEHCLHNEVHREHSAVDDGIAVLQDARRRNSVVVAVGNEQRHPIKKEHQHRKYSYQKPPNGLLSLYHFQYVILVF